ncbi:MAG: efflux RND transporter permease subunit [Planctomycetales bacterium]|nr:efflux RND transporter permease subunit [Planctomycetales bacterium]
MLNVVIRYALTQRILTIAVALILLCVGTWQISVMPVDVFPDLNRPRVVIMTEAPGMAPEEVESLITFPIETAVNGANGVETVRSSSGVGISVIYVEFAYGTDIYTDRQIVAERMQLVQDRLPAGIAPQLAPISSIMGQVLMLAMWSQDPQTSPMELRTAADWIVRQRLLTIPGVSQVFTMGGQRKQFQVLVDPEAMLRLGVTLEEIESSVAASNQNGTGGYLSRQGPSELLVRSLGRLQSIEELRKVPVTIRDGSAVQLSQVAQVVEGAQVKRGDSSAFVRTGPQGDQTPMEASWQGGAAVVLTINKQPGADTRQVSEAVLAAIEELKTSLPSGVEIKSIYAQKSFIDRAIENVVEALRDGGVLVVIILYLFLLNLRTTFITLTAIPLSLVMTAIVFAFFGLSINTMTLGGIAVALGELVDDAIVDVENIYRRLKQNRSNSNPLHPLLVVYRASVEVRRSIVFGTIIVILVFLPLFALGGMEGRLFAPLGVAYIVSILSSLLVSLTVTPVLSYWLLGSKKSRTQESDGWVLIALKWIARRVISFSLRVPRFNVFCTLLMVAIAGLFLSRLEKDFLPPFNEGTVQLNVVLPPGTSLDASNAIAAIVEDSLKRIPDVYSFARRTGRAELDEHAEGVNMSEIIIELNPESNHSREFQLGEIRRAMEEIPGIVTAVEQPIAHLISHMISGVKAQVGIKVYGDDLDILRQNAEAIEEAMQQVDGVTDVLIEPQVTIPQLRIELDRDRLLQYGLTAATVNEYIQTAMNGTVVSEVLDGMRTFDLLVRMQEEYREDIDQLKRLSIHLPEGGTLPLSALARVYESGGPNTVNRENVRRRAVIQCNVKHRGVVDVVTDIQRVIAPIAQRMPAGYFVQYSGQFESQQKASITIGVFFGLAMVGVFLVLFLLFRSVNLALQVMAALPMAFVGAVAALVLTGQTLTIAAMVGFISLAGIASRNGILLLQHYLHLVQNEGEEFNQSMIIRAGLERLAPVLMTALTSGIGLVPLVLSAGEPGKEILYPVATVILGGLVSSTMLDFFVHPALFWLFGIQAARSVVDNTMQQPELPI